MILLNNNQKSTVYSVVIFAVVTLIIFKHWHIQKQYLSEIIKSFQEDLKNAGKLLNGLRQLRAFTLRALLHSDCQLNYLFFEYIV